MVVWWRLPFGLSLKLCCVHVTLLQCVMVSSYTGMLCQNQMGGGNQTEADYYRVVSLMSEHVNAPIGNRPGQATTSDSCQDIRSVPRSLRSRSQIKPNGLDTFYQKYTEAYGIPVLSSSRVSDNALRRACYILRFLLAGHSEVRRSFYKLSGRVAVIGVNEGTTDIPEHRHLPSWWNKRARGLGATPHAPVSSGGEENVLCLSSDRYREDIYLHESVHGVHLLGAAFAIPGWDARLRSLYRQAKSRGLWANTYSMSTPEEYFAEGTQSYFNVNGYSPRPDGVRGPISTRAKLRTYDPALYRMIREVFPCDNAYLKRCSSTRAQERDQVLSMDCNEGGGGGASTVRPRTTTTTTVPINCRDDNRSCRRWASSGECRKNPKYMLVSCKESCNHCTITSTRSPTSTTTPIQTTRPPSPLTTVHPTDCVDQSDYCRFWSSTGECEKNPDYMKVNCKRSCNICGRETLCTDSSAHCEYWAGTGECGRNTAFMRVNCGASCELC